MPHTNIFGIKKHRQTPSNRRLTDCTVSEKVDPCSGPAFRFVASRMSHEVHCVLITERERERERERRGGGSGCITPEMALDNDEN